MELGGEGGGVNFFPFITISSISYSTNFSGTIRLYTNACGPGSLTFGQERREKQTEGRRNREEEVKEKIEEENIN